MRWGNYMENQAVLEFLRDDRLNSSLEQNRRVYLNFKMACMLIVKSKRVDSRHEESR